jgi:hypothetical protein
MSVGAPSVARRPYYDASGTAGHSGIPLRRLLLISYHFPPDTAVGGLRWQRLSRFIAERGWGLDVIARDLRKMKVRDDRRLAVLPPAVRVYAAAEGEPLSARVERLAIKALRRAVPRERSESPPSFGREELKSRAFDVRNLVRAHGAWISIASEKIWARSAVRIGNALARAHRYDAVLSSGPPHMAHDAARRIAMEAGIPLIIDFRDPWSGLERLPEDHASPLYFSLLRRYERAAVGKAALVIMNNDRARDDMRARYPAAADRIITVRNGADDDPVPAVERSRRFSIRFAGSICLDRDPRFVFRAASMAVRRLGLTPDDFRIELIGTVEEIGGRTVREIAEEEGVADFVDIGGQQPHDVATHFLAGATMLLNLPQDSDLCVPAKIFEYVRFDSWLLVLATPASATAETLRDTNADIVDPHDVEQMAAIIERRYQQHARGERPLAAGRDGRFDRQHQARILLDHLEAITGAPR